MNPKSNLQLTSKKAQGPGHHSGGQTPGEANTFEKNDPGLALVHDLDVQYGSDGTVFYPWGFDPADWS